jgi:hypothetical protein
MARLTIDQRAKRNTTRKNNKIRQQYPLLADAGVIDDWYTDAEAEKERLGEWDKSFEQQQERLRLFRRRYERSTGHLEWMIRRQVSEADFELMQRYYTRVFPGEEYRWGFYREALMGKFNVDEARAILAKIQAP